MSYKKFTILLLVLVLALSANAIELRAGIGQLYPIDKDFKADPNQLFVELGFDFLGPISAGIGGRYINFGEIKEDFGGALDISTYERRIDGWGSYVYGKFQPELGEEARLAPYASAATGLHITYPSVELKYLDGTSYRTVEGTSPSETVPFVMFCGGVEIIFSKIGIFLQGSYIESAKIPYEAFKVLGHEVSPGGEVDPSGWQVYLGVAIH